MKNLFRFLAALAACTMVAGPLVARADDATGVRKELLASLTDAGDKLIELAQAVPANKYSWRPSKDVRSAGEVFLHVTLANFMQPSFYGLAVPENSPVTKDNMGTFEKSTTDKAKIVQMLKDSFEYQKKLIGDTSDADLDQQVSLFGVAMSRRAAMLMLVNHAHEHLGQSIAYARSNSVTPPWTAREQAEAAKKKADAAASKGGGMK